ncbi:MULTISPECIES: hypothetical protein [Pseudomonas]|uniref:hypothetical protein n=1 Tax=Pseudomonas TaxID=286 RepID=UPI000DA81241|nr:MULTISPECIES: hypothetical protein [Pseudomonas]MDW3712139.1 hypothetical protein [Pseudomonas sp. 2023EL-01195]PZE10731.1 hypothetical protein DMX10_24350 [Pseudomonas sp. 57B-090624]
MREIKLPISFERIRGFTRIVDGVFHIVNYDEVIRVTLGEPPSAQDTDDDPYAFEDDHHEDFYGVTDKRPHLANGTHEVSYDFMPSQNETTVTVRAPSGTHDIVFPTRSGDWFVATLEDEGRYLVIAEPWSLRLYELQA